MNLTARFFFLIASVSGVSLLTASASANPAALKCNSQRDQIWVYDSFNSFGVEAKLKCGDNVEIIERVTNYVKIRARNGVEGYIPDTSVADLPPLQVRQDPALDVGLAAKQAQAQEIANATAKAAEDAARFATPPSAGAANEAPAKSTSDKKSPAGGSMLPVAAYGEMNAPRATPPAGDSSSRAISAHSKAPTGNFSEISDSQPESLARTSPARTTSLHTA